MSSVTAHRPTTVAGIKGFSARKLLEWGGIAAGIVLIAFGVTAIVMGVDGRSTVRDSLKQEQIVGTPDMTPAAIKAEAQQAGLKSVAIPSKSVAGQPINSGDRARTFAQYMRIHALEATGGLTYAQMGRFLTPAGKATSDEKLAAKDPKTGKPVENAARNLWVTETALTTALNTSYMAEQLSIFGIVVGIALLLSGIGFVVLAVGGALRHREVKSAT